MKRVTGIGGIFFKTKDPEKLKQWYSTHLGIKSDKYGGCFDLRKPDGTKGFTDWSTFKEDTKYFQPSEKEMMINYRVENLEELLKLLKEEEVAEGNKIELWEPNDIEFEKKGSDTNTST